LILSGPRSARHGLVQLREITPDDSERLFLWRMDPAARVMFRHTAPVPYRDHEAILVRYFSPANHDRWFVIEAGGEAVGAIALYHLSADGREAEWGRFVIAPERRGRGWGRRALVALLRHARDLGLERLSCDVLAGNPAERLYRSLGFTDAWQSGGPAPLPEPDGRLFLPLARDLADLSDLADLADLSVLTEAEPEEP
jgi:RimJ/RimL family protein N-acetyltransferase